MLPWTVCWELLGGAGEIFLLLFQNLGSIPSTHGAAYNSNSSLEDPAPSSGL